MRARPTAAAFAAACLCFPVAVAAGATTHHLTAGATAAPPAFGVADDTGKYADDGGAAFDTGLLSGGMTEARWTVTFDGDPATIGDQAFLDRAVPVADADGVDVTLSLFPAHAQVPDPTTFCQWVGNVATRYPTITKFIVGNEVNATRFWSPQHTDADPNAGPDTYEQTLAQCYDVLKSINPSIQVIGMGLAPRAVSDSSTKPLDFIRAVGAAYRASHRTAPLMDALAIHPYPNPNASPPPPPDRAAYDDPGFFGITQLDRVKQAVYDAFGGTPQPTTINGLHLVIDELGYQSNETGNPQYTGTESSPTVSEAQQAAYYARVVQLYSCDPSVSDVLFFHLIDEANLNVTPTSGGWQSGLEYPDGTAKPSLAAVQLAITAGCTGPLVTWTPTVAPKAKPKPHLTLVPKPHAKPRPRFHKPKPTHHKPKHHHHRRHHRRR
ncbi:MAG TPA: hypothetical protein VLK36_07740 [Gaiellaceae bacterium]|nr:hypothetical protein [Gaiellaceae bacterium]